MARWRLTTAHYLKVPGVEWEQQQTSQQTGKSIRFRREVPQLLDPSDLNDCNYKTPDGGGEIIVCLEGLGHDRDITFFGSPTPDMEPLDEEAKAITASLQAKWSRHPIESLAAQGGFGEAMFQDLQKQLEAAIRNAATSVAAPTQSLAGVSAADFAALAAQVNQLMQQNLELQAKLAGAEPVEPIEDLVELPTTPATEPAPARAERRA